MSGCQCFSDHFKWCRKHGFKSLIVVKESEPAPKSDVVWSCPVCHHICKSKIDRKNHIYQIHRYEKNFECPRCDQKFRWQALLDKHMNGHQKRIAKQMDEKNMFCCTACKKRFSSQNELKSHEYVCSKLKIFKCELCEKQFTKSHDLKRHGEFVHEKKRNFKCDSCSKTFQMKTHLKRHENTCKLKIENEIKCELCHFKFARKEDLNRHIDYVHKEIKQFQCPSCELAFKRRFDLNRHFGNIHEQNDDAILKCEKCAQTFTRKSDLKRHNLNFHVRKSVSCPKCSRKISKNLLEWHIKWVHETKERKFECDVCKVKFKHQFHLKAHQNIYHSRSNNYSCSFCNKLFMREQELDEHQANEHNLKNNYACPECFFKCDSRQALAVHDCFKL